MFKLIRIAMVAAVSCLSTTTVINANDERPNILFIFADDVGREVLGCYGGESYKTPNLDELAREGKRFTHCYSMPVCHPSRVCLLTGRYPAVIGNPAWGSFPDSLEAQTFANILRNAGYRTAVAGKWQLSLMKDDLQQPRRLGFDEWSLFGWHEGPRYHDPMIYENGHLRNDTLGMYGPDLYVEFLVDFMQRNDSKPFLAFYSMALCHDVTDDLEKPVPYGPDGRWLNYTEMAEDMDRQIGKLLTALDSAGLREKTLVLFTTDNGTAGASYLRFENGKFERPPVISRYKGRDIRGGKGDLTDWGTRVPLIARWTGRIKSSVVDESLVDFSDFLPTFSEMAEATLPQDLNGISFAGALFDTGSPKREWVYSESRRTRYVRTQRYKLYSSGEFFDMQADESESNPLSVNKLSDDVRSIHTQLQGALDALPEPR